MDFSKSFLALKTYTEHENFAGWDPYDGLNSKLFQNTPLKKSALARLIMIQLFKRNPVNLRKLFLIPKGHNPKGIGLFLTGYCNIYNLQKSLDKEIFGKQDDILEKINYLAKKLIHLQSGGYSGACWGYNFDWQNRVFFQPKGTPTVVATSFIADSLFNAFNVTGNHKYLDVALSSIDFVLKDLNRTKDKNGFIFSYSPLDTSKVYNATLLGVRLLARGYSYTKNKDHKKLAKQAIVPIINKQNSNGSWIYGEAKTQNWIDSFHTGYNLECISDYAYYTKDNQFLIQFEKGFDFYLNNFFLADGTPKYYHNKLYPIDIHAPAQFLVTLSKTGKLGEHLELAKKVLKWTINNMQDEKGYFYYQLKPFISSKIPYMRWAQAWMFYAFTHYFYTLTKYENLD